MAKQTLLSTCTSVFQRGPKRPINLLAPAQPRRKIVQPHRIDAIYKYHGKLTSSVRNTNGTANKNIGTKRFSTTTTRHIHTSPSLYMAKSEQALQKRSPFSRFDKINVSDNFAIRRELKEGDNTYGVRRYLLLPRTDYDADYKDEDQSSYNIIASLNANRNVLFGAQLHAHSDTDSGDNYDEYVHEYLAACGSLLDIAREDASLNGQQIQAVAVMNGLCSWVEECLEKDGEGSDVLMGLMHGEQQPNTLLKKDDDENKLPPGKRAGMTIKDASAELILENESDRIQMLEAIRAIATGTPRPGHSVVGAGTYRDGMQGWVALAREYSQLATNPDSVSLDASYVGRRGLEEMALYKSRDGEVTKIEHLAHTQPEYLKEAGGAMARIFFV